jgi:hypothetical protein
MSVLTKLLAGTVLGAGVVAGYSYIKRLGKTKAELEIQPKAMLHRINWNGIIIRVDVLMKNPTSGSFAIKFPFVKISYKDTTIGSSQVVNKDIIIPPHGQAQIEKIMVEIPVTSVFSLVYGLVKALYNKEAVHMSVKTMTTVDIGIAKVPYEETKEVIIKK